MGNANAKSGNKMEILLGEENAADMVTKSKEEVEVQPCTPMCVDNVNVMQL